MIETLISVGQFGGDLSRTISVAKRVPEHRDVSKRLEGQDARADARQNSSSSSRAD